MSMLPKDQPRSTDAEREFFAAPPPPARDGFREAVGEALAFIEIAARQIHAEGRHGAFTSDAWKQCSRSMCQWAADVSRAALVAGQAGEEVGAFWCNHCRVRCSRFADLEAHLSACRARDEALRAAEEVCESYTMMGYAPGRFYRAIDALRVALAKLRAGLGAGAGGG